MSGFTEKELLERQIEEAQRRLHELQEKEKSNKKSECIKELYEYTTEEKVKWFDDTYQRAREELNELQGEDYCDDNDNKHYAWEHYIEILARDKGKFWNFWNSFL